VIVKIHEQSRGTYGAPRVTAELRLGLGYWVNHKRVARLMRERGLHSVSRRRPPGVCARRGVFNARSQDLVHHQFCPEHPDRLCVQDITQRAAGQDWGSTLSLLQLSRPCGA
jgi:putative transposase